MTTSSTDGTPPPEPPGGDPGVTVIVPTYNREPTSAQSVEDLLAQDYAPLEILIVDQSDDPVLLPQLAARHPDVISYHRPTFRGITYARNFGWQNSRYETLVYIDDDIRCGPEFVRRHVEAQSDSGAAIIAGGIEQTVRAAYVDRIGYFHRPTARSSPGWDSTTAQSVDHAPGANFSTTRSVLRAAGGFDQQLDVGNAMYEETECFLHARSLGYQIFFQPTAHLTHLVVPSGGTRQRSQTTFTYGMAHNRALVIRRYTPRRHWPRAAAAVARMVWQRAWEGRSPQGLVAGVIGAVRGFVVGGRPRQCSEFTDATMPRAQSPADSAVDGRGRPDA